MKKSEKKSESEKIILPEHYSSIDYLPMLNWERIHKTKDVAHLLVKNEPLTDKQRAELDLVWYNVNNEYIQVFGFGEDFKLMLDKQIQIGKLKLKKIITKDDSIQNFIRAEEIKLEGIKKRIGNGGGDIYDAKKIIEKQFGVRLPMKEVTVREFYSYMKDVKKLNLLNGIK